MQMKFSDGQSEFLRANLFLAFYSITAPKTVR